MCVLGHKPWLRNTTAWYTQTQIISTIQLFFKRKFVFYPPLPSFPYTHERNSSFFFVSLSLGFIISNFKNKFLFFYPSLLSCFCFFLINVYLSLSLSFPLFHFRLQFVQKISFFCFQNLSKKIVVFICLNQKKVGLLFSGKGFVVFTITIDVKLQLQFLILIVVKISLFFPEEMLQLIFWGNAIKIENWLLF